MKNRQLKKRYIRENETVVTEYKFYLILVLITILSIYVMYKH